MSKTLLLLTLLALMLSQGACDDWQAAGNMTTYLTPIWSFIDAAIADNLPKETISTDISDECNSLWD